MVLPPQTIGHADKIRQVGKLRHKGHTFVEIDAMMELKPGQSNSLYTQGIRIEIIVDESFAMVKRQVDIRKALIV